MSIKERAKNPFQIKYLRAYLSQKKYDNGYFSYTDITLYIIESGIGNYKKSIDTSDFDIGYFEESNIQITIDNSKGNFSEGSGFFELAYRDQSKIKLIAGYYKPETMNGDAAEPEAEFEVDFEGIIDDRSTTEDADTDNIIITVLSYTSIFKRLKIIPNLITNGLDFKDAIFRILNQPSITDLFAVDINNINPGLNLPIDNGSFFDNKKVDESIAKLLLAGSCVIDIIDNIIYFKSRIESDTVRFEFFGKGSHRPANIKKLSNIKSGMARIITRVIINNTNIYESADYIINKYGARDKKIDLGFMTDSIKLEQIGQNILNEFQIPKQELTIQTDYIANEINLLDLITVDNEGFIIDEEPALYGEAIYGDAKYVTVMGGTKISSLIGFKILSKKHNYKNYLTSLKIRRIGTKVGDEYLAVNHALYGTAIYGVSSYNS